MTTATAVTTATVNRSDLLIELQLCAAIIEKRATIPILSYLLLTAAEDSLHIRATDLELSLRTSCPARVIGSGSVVVQSDTLLQIVRNAPADEIEIEVEDSAVHVSSGKSRFRVPTLAATDFPISPDSDGCELVADVDLEHLQTALARVVFCVSEKSFALAGPVFRLTAEKLELFATDGTRASVAQLRVTNAKARDFMLSAKACRALSRIEASGFARIAVNGSFTFISLAEGRTLAERRQDLQQYPDPHGVVPDANHVVIAKREALRDAITRSLIAAGDSKKVNVSMTRNQLALTAARFDGANTAETVDVEYSGTGFELSFNAEALHQYLSSIDSNDVRLEFDNEHVPFMATALGHGDPVGGFYLLATMQQRKAGV